MAATGTRSAALVDLPGAPETRLEPDLVPLLPAVTPAPPWTTRVEALLWWHRAAPDAVDAMAEPLRARRGLPVTVGAFIRYAETPVGPYSEFLGSPLLVRAWTMRVHVPLIAVDSIASVHGGRAHWALPKAMASFTWTDLDRAGAATAGGGLRAAARPHAQVTGEGWSAAATARPFGPRLPVASIGTLEQVDAHGHSLVARVRVLARARPALVDVERSDDASYASWLLPGRHPGVVVTSGRVTVGPTKTSDASSRENGAR